MPALTLSISWWAPSRLSRRELSGPVSTEKSELAKSMTRSVALSARLMLTDTSRTAIVTSGTPTRRAEAASASRAMRVASCRSTTTVKLTRPCAPAASTRLPSAMTDTVCQS